VVGWLLGALFHGYTYLFTYNKVLDEIPIKPGGILAKVNTFNMIKFSTANNYFTSTNKVLNSTLPPPQ